ncbi:unnamed protein product [Adineta ricciae]|uniref:Uncharacterized protein n=1 Tax=Adineta ricciae TaxID=249248 RepID=A0A814RL42_ADIRI|nr:unnamed protein product [Adineta ricciae]CAF1133657.1 unnamed protein product [Adineta ricciae]
MAASIVTDFGIALHDVDKNTPDKIILRFLKKYSTGNYKINKRGTPYRKNGEERQRIYIGFDSLQSVDEFMRQRPFTFDGKLLKVMRSLPKSRLYDRMVTGLKINIESFQDEHLLTDKVNENDLKKHFQYNGTILSSKWMNSAKTEALFQFEDYDAVDRSIICNQILKIKGRKIDLEKYITDADRIANNVPYCIHVRNLPVRVTSEELADMFEVRIPFILVHPCFLIEQAHSTDARTTSEAWIKGFRDKADAQHIAEKNSGKTLRRNRIVCQVMQEEIDEDELCTKFLKGQCPYTNDTCHFKHISCDEPDTCENPDCWYGHTDVRSTKPHFRPPQRLEDARYRVKLSNLPPDVTHDDLIKRLNINSKFDKHLILQPSDGNSTKSSITAYLVRQPSENRLRQLINKYHDTFYSSTRQQRIQCQLELAQEFFEWNDNADITSSVNSSRCASPTRSLGSTCSSRSRLQQSYSSVVAANTVEHSQMSKQPYTSSSISTNRSTVQKDELTSSSQRSQTQTTARSSPSDMSQLAAQWKWTGEMMNNDSSDTDQQYWLKNSSKKGTNAIIKIYSSGNHGNTLLRARRERIALQQLSELRNCVPKICESNVVDEASSKTEFWTIMKLMDGERLSDDLKVHGKVPLLGALEICRSLLMIIKQVHNQKIVHRDIQPRNILIQRNSTTKDFKLMLVNFTSAWIDGNELISCMKPIEEQWSSEFYLVPQLEEINFQTNQQVQPCQYSPTIDASGTCALLFWLLTGHKPRASRDISGNAPHQLRDNVKIIESKIGAVTSFNDDRIMYQHIETHLRLIFDRGFARPDQQWSIDELDYQLQCIIMPLQNKHERTDYFPVSSTVNTNPTLSVIPFEDPFVCMVSMIYNLKTRLVNRFLKCMGWSSQGKNQWITEDKRIENRDMLIFGYQGTNLTIDIHWNVTILENDRFKLVINAKGPDTVNSELPLGSWNIRQPSTDFEILLKSVELKIKILICILSQS